MSDKIWAENTKILSQLEACIGQVLSFYLAKGKPVADRTATALRGLLNACHIHAVAFSEMAPGQLSYCSSDNGASCPEIGRRRGKVSTVLALVVDPEQRDLIPDHIFRDVAQALHNALFPDSLTCVEVTGHEIVEAYTSGFASTSCMSGSSKQTIAMLRFYMLNPDKVSMCKFYSNLGATARALKWKTDCGNLVLDRIYPNDSPMLSLIHAYCKDNGIIMRAHNGAPRSTQDVPLDNGQFYCATMKASSYSVECMFPFLDTFAYSPQKLRYFEDIAGELYDLRYSAEPSVSAKEYEIILTNEWHRDACFMSCSGFPFIAEDKNNEPNIWDPPTATMAYTIAPERVPSPDEAITAFFGTIRNAAETSTPTAF